MSGESKSGKSIGEDHIKLVDGTNHTGKGTTRVDVRSGSDSAGASQIEPEEAQKNVVHVRNDIMVSADNIV